MQRNDAEAIKKKGSVDLFYLFLFLAVSAVAIFFPPTADDLAWATGDGLALLKRGFKDYNGRYLGNLAALALTRVPHLLPFVKGAVATVTVYLTQRLLPCQSERFRCLTALLLLLPCPLLRQAFVWTAGFSNYFLSLPILLSCAYLLLFKRSLRGEKKAAALIALFIMGIAGQLFMEPFTVFCLIGAICAAVFFTAKERKPDLPALVYLIACVIGAVIMFRNGAYTRILRGENTYQSLTAQKRSVGGLVLNGLHNLTHTVSLNFLLACVPALLAIAVLTVLLLKRSTVGDKALKKSVYALYGASAAGIPAFAVAYLFTKEVEKSSPALFFTLFAFLLAAGFVVYFCMDQPCRRRIALYLSMIAVQCAPLCFVFPVGPRCFSGAFLLLILITGELFLALEAKDGQKSASGTAHPRAFRNALLIVLAIDLICYSLVFFANIKKIETIREEVKKGATQITIAHTPFRFFVYSLDIEDKSEKYNRRFCEYYGLPEGTKISYK